MKLLSGTTRILGILGNPVAHSLSPAMQNAAIAACDLDYIYIPFPVMPDYLAAAVSGLRAVGVRGFNVTIPYKSAIISYVDELDESAAAAGAVNTVLVSDGVMTGYNTDGPGFICSLSDDLGFTAGAGTVIVIGAGGAARGAVAALCISGAERIVVVNRTLVRAVRLAEEMRDRYPETSILAASPDKTTEEHFFGSAALLVNATSIGMNGDRIGFFDLATLPKGVKIYDMVYSPAETPLLREAASLGIQAVNGLGMLASQGELSFKIWTGTTPPKGLMKLVLQGVCNP